MATLHTRQQISLVVVALEPYFLDLTKDQHGNHVLQRCLQCLGYEDIKVQIFIFYFLVFISNDASYLNFHCYVCILLCPP